MVIMTSSQSSIRQTMGAAEWILLLTVSFLWGITYFFVGVAVDVYAPLFVVLAWVGIAAIALVLLLIVSAHTTPYIAGNLAIALYHGDIK